MAWENVPFDFEGPGEGDEDPGFSSSGYEWDSLPDWEDQDLTFPDPVAFPEISFSDVPYDFGSTDFPEEPAEEPDDYSDELSTESEADRYILEDILGEEVFNIPDDASNYESRGLFVNIEDLVNYTEQIGWLNYYIEEYDYGYELYVDPDTERAGG